MRKIDRTGMKYHNLLVVKDAGKRWHTGRMRRFWHCLCDCGKSIEACGDTITIVKSCGCLNHLGIHSLLHGETGKREFNIWVNMRQRCYNESNPSYKNYGLRGIKVCDSWKNSYESFISDIGKVPSSKYTLDRIDSNGNYEPSNCRWTTMKEQQNNRTNNARFEYNGASKTVAQWSEELGFTYNRMYKLLRIHGKTIEDIVTLGLK